MLRVAVTTYSARDSERMGMLHGRRSPQVRRDQPVKSSVVHAADRLQLNIEASGSVACVGLDPRPSLLPPSLRDRHRGRHGDPRVDVAAAFEEFNLAILDAIAGRCSVVKPQAACYEAYGPPGWRALESTIAAARQRGFIVILDAKRSDVGSTATHYGQMAFGGAPDLGDSATSGIGADWMTVNPYLGADGVEPIIDASPTSHVGILVLVKTSNPSSGDVQDTSSGDATVSDAVADRVAEWGAKRMGDRGLSDVGAVVGATYPDHARRLRERMPNTIFLVPGYGAQGAGPADALAGLRTDGRGVLVSSSRGIIGAWQDGGTDDWGEAAGGALDAMNLALDRHR